MLVVADLHKSYGPVLALDGVDLQVEGGDVIGLLGPNGAGKTTLVSIICGLRRADRGTVFVNGDDALAHPQRARRHIGLAPQDTGIYPMVTARQNLELFAELSGMRRLAVADQIDRVAEALRLGPLLDRKAGELSGGQKRRLHTAIALLNSPPLILLDEATTGADVETRAALLEVVRNLASEGSAVIYSTHYLHEVETLGASVVILEKGRVMANGSVSELIMRHGHAVVELEFEGRPPGGPQGFEVTVEDTLMRIRTDDPARSTTRILGALGADAGRVISIEIIKPSLETVYLSLTGRRFEAGEEADVMAS